MTNPPPDRLDRIEAILESEAERWAETRRIVESNARAIAANSDAIATNSDAIAQQREEMRANITDVVGMVGSLAEQAEIDRAEFRATVQQLLETLNQRFTSNGH